VFTLVITPPSPSPPIPHVVQSARGILHHLPRGSRDCLPVRCTQTGLRSLPLAAYDWIRPSRRSSAPSIYDPAGDQSAAGGPKPIDSHMCYSIRRWIWGGSESFPKGVFR
jgi:hypothetical protein